MKDTRDQKFRMNLQLFAEPSEVSEPTESSEPTEPKQPSNPQTTFTLDEVMKLVQAEADKRVTAALKKQEKAFEKKMSLSGLDEQQRALAERDQQIADQKELIRNLTIAQNSRSYHSKRTGSYSPSC